MEHGTVRIALLAGTELDSPAETVLLTLPPGDFPNLKELARRLPGNRFLAAGWWHARKREWVRRRWMRT